MALFADRREAGARLGETLRQRLGAPDDPGGLQPLVLGLPRGGVIVAAEVAQALQCPIDVVVVRKLGHPARPELGLGALAETGERVLNQPLVHRLQVPEQILAVVTDAERLEARRRVAHYRGGRPPLPLRGRVAVIVDDGLATGYTALVAVESVRGRGASRVVVAVPVGSADTVAMLATRADTVICLASPPDLSVVGEAYRDFSETHDDEVVAVLERLGRSPAGG